MGISVTDQSVPGCEAVLTSEALAFIEKLDQQFHDRRDELLAARKVRREEIKRTGKIDFLAETQDVRNGDWKVAPAPSDLLDRRVEITGPTDPKMAINALNSGARVWLADLEDSNTPHWENQLTGQLVLQGMARGDLTFDSSEGKHYELAQDRRIATTIVRPRGWHFDERHVLVNGRPVVAALFDAGMHLFHNAKTLIARGSGPYFYLPKMESHKEARLWNDVFVFAQNELGIPQGTVRATVLIETITAAFEMEEILYELRDHSSGLNAGRWDYMFSIVKNFRDSGEKYFLPDRKDLTMDAPMMKAYSDLLVKTCHKRGAFAIGGMAAFIPSRKNEEINKIAFDKVRSDKQREAKAGFDGSWVAHPDLVPLCKEIFDEYLGENPNQLGKQRDDVHVTADDLLSVDKTPGSITEAGLRVNIDIGLQYLDAWLNGNGAAAIHHMMEDAATAEISRSQVWQQFHNGVVYEDTGRKATKELIHEILGEEQARLEKEGFEPVQLQRTRELFERVALDEDYADFLTLPALDEIS